MSARSGNFHVFSTSMVAYDMWLHSTKSEAAVRPAGRQAHRHNKSFKEACLFADCTFHKVCVVSYNMSQEQDLLKYQAGLRPVNATVEGELSVQVHPSTVTIRGFFNREANVLQFLCKPGRKGSSWPTIHTERYKLMQHNTKTKKAQIHFAQPENPHCSHV